MTFLVVALLGAGVCRGQVKSFGISGGYSRLESNDSGRLSHARDGAYFDGDFAWKIGGMPVPVYAGFGASGSGYFQTRDVLFPITDTLSGVGTLYSDVGIFSLEARVAAPIGFQRGRGFFVMPRLGLGLVLNDYAIDRSRSVGSTVFLNTTYHDGAAFGIRPSLQAGYSWGTIAAGAEVSYMVAWGDFGELGNTARELRAGAFMRFQW
jgi:hypothetical protein